MKTQMKLAIFFATFIVLAVLTPVHSAHAVKYSKASVKSDMPLPQLLSYAAGDINKFWLLNFNSSRRRYIQPSLIYYTQPIRTPCGVAVMNNAFYCAAANTIYYDYNFINNMYSNVGDYAAVSIIAHEWGHLVQAQLGVGQGLSIQMELQADCLAGAYTQYAKIARELEEGDMEEAGVGLFNAGDPRGMPWFAAQAHGKPMDRISAFLDGYKGGVRVCFSR
ncbi:MAG TPA: neutral zinc metallopeptidase [Pyrinomonadaceae bacterium]|jgi:hypothetical protein|nr:neutral zinc metallopeptidase [Pyrinomonadaceae bacterium]